MAFYCFYRALQRVILNDLVERCFTKVIHSFKNITVHIVLVFYQ